MPMVWLQGRNVVKKLLGQQQNSSFFYAGLYCSSFGGGPPTFLRDAFLGSFFLRENVNLMYFVRDVVIESLDVITF